MGEEGGEVLEPGFEDGLRWSRREGLYRESGDEGSKGAVRVAGPDMGGLRAREVKAWMEEGVRRSGEAQSFGRRWR